MAQANLQGSNINLVKQHNLQVILLNLLYEPVLSRSQLAKQTGLSNTTITNLIAELISQGIVTEKSSDDLEQGELRPVGRSCTRICLEPNARFVIGVHIGVGIFRVSLTNLRAEILHNHMQYFETDSPDEKVLKEIVSVVEAVISESDIEREKILGVGIGASGLVDFTTGVNLLAPNLDWLAPLQIAFLPIVHNTSFCSKEMPNTPDYGRYRSDEWYCRLGSKKEIE